MRSLRRLGLLCAVAAGAGVLAGPAPAAVPRPGGLPNTLDSAHFRVHYQSDAVGTAFAITQTTAGDVAARAERALTAELADGYPMPVSDGVLGGDSRIDIYVMDLTGSGAVGLTDWDADTSQTSGFVILAGNAPEQGFSLHTIAHELFHVIQLSAWLPLPLPQQATDFWLLEGSAEWMGYRVDGYDAAGGPDLGPPDMALDCRDPIGTSMCDLLDDYKNNGYSRWPFFEYLSENYGPSFLSAVLARGASGATATGALAGALGGLGTTLADQYDAWAAADLVGGYSVSALQGRTPSVVGRWTTGAKGGALGTSRVAVNHLSTRIVEFERGDGDATHACYAATLSLTVDLPAGTLSKPVFWWNAPGSSAVPLAVSGNTASAALPWDTCTWASTRGYLALPNASLSVDAADFVVHASMTVDPTKVATAGSPPDQVFVPTPTLPVTAVAPAPTLQLFGPEILRLSAKDTRIRLIVESSGQGTVCAKLGSLDLGSAALRGGNNDVRLKLPQSALAALRRSAAASSLLSLMPVSTDGATTGRAVTRTIRITPAKPKAGKPARRK